MSTKGNIEEKITSAMVKIQKEKTGRGADQGKCYIVQDMVIVRLKGVLTPTEKQLMRNSDGLRLIKETWNQLEEITRPLIEEIIYKTTGLKVVSVHFDINTETDERIHVFILEKDLETELSLKT